MASCSHGGSPAAPQGPSGCRLLCNRRGFCPIVSWAPSHFSFRCALTPATRSGQQSHWPTLTELWRPVCLRIHHLPYLLSISLPPGPHEPRPSPVPLLPSFPAAKIIKKEENPNCFSASFCAVNCHPGILGIISWKLLLWCWQLQEPKQTVFPVLGS